MPTKVRLSTYGKCICHSHIGSVIEVLYSSLSYWDFVNKDNGLIDLQFNQTILYTII